ncbi:helix-turn-helix domain-containing protein [Methanothrix soehngenii]|uniref:GbsR/MarR family transcriptional regulator n=1 Tax=Methanothrix soehngenii TaxID=2223 RepID=UPI002C95713B|nr:helix-turn-helix domain-containing protein [Methanothrix soehngenii]HNT46640.1 helix-turn-helix domain-containing protein [Methanothrix soehngenii]
MSKIYLNFMSELGIVKYEEILAIKMPLVEACIKSAKRNGWGDAMGLIRGILFLESEPMSLDELAEKTGYSKTTLRSNLNSLENFGLVTRVVSPLGKQHRYKQHRYALQTDSEAMRLVVQSTAREEIRLILQALNQVEKNLEARGVVAENMGLMMSKTRHFYEEMDRVMELMNQFTLNEIIEILEKNINERSTLSI